MTAREDLDLAAYRICQDITDYVAAEVARHGEKISIPDQHVTIHDGEGNPWNVKLGGTCHRAPDPLEDFTPEWEKTAAAEHDSFYPGQTVVVYDGASEPGGDPDRVWAVVYDGDPMMSGGCERRQLSGECRSLADALAAMAIIRQRGSAGRLPGLRIETRHVTPWTRADDTG